MPKSKKKMRRLTQAQYEEYIAALKDDAALYESDGKLFVPDEIKPDEKSPSPDGD